jgi:hypothetical protein
MTKLDLGHTVKDKLTNFKGLITGHARYITGCDQYLVCERKPNGHSKWVDAHRLKLVKKKRVVLKNNTGKDGADLPAPIK